MFQSMAESNPELESFRQQWRAEVSKRKDDKGDRKAARAEPLNSGKSTRRLPGPSQHVPVGDDQDGDGEEEIADDETHHELESASENVVSGEMDVFSKRIEREPRSALEHYEKAVERESQGNLGDSLNLYRKAFRMDHRVDLQYKNKHFPPSYFAARKAAAAASSTVETSVPSSSLVDVPQLIAGFANLSIEPAAPEIEGTPAPPCPIAALPDEIITQILTQTVVLDLVSFVRLAQVCKRMAYLFATEQQIWKRICLGPEVGFEAMHYEWQREINWMPLEDSLSYTLDGIPQKSVVSKRQISESLFKEYSSSWQRMFRYRPRIRFSGCYISTVNYIRAGQGSTNSLTWNNPVHIVTYYRYLRFFRDGTVISLLTTTEPIDVVHYLTKELLETHKGGTGTHLPSAVMSHALKGRWRLSSSSDNPEADLKDAEGDVYVETDGVDPKYIYRMELSLRSVGKGAKNNKMAWKGFWSYNKLTDDWGEFGLRNDKAFFWSRVKSYGMGA
jgi:F-box protein 9